MTKYPKRDKFFSHKFVRILHKACACQAIGRDAALLCVFIAHTEDAAKYSGPVRFWNSQLSETMAFKSPKQLTEARKRAIDAGWLVYLERGNRSTGEYFVTIPQQFEALKDAPMVDEFDSSILSADGMNNGTNNGMNLDLIAERIAERILTRTRNESCLESGTNCGKPPIPVPGPVPEPEPLPEPNTPPNPQGGTCGRVGTTEDDRPKRRTKPDTSPGFDEWFAVYPRHVAKAAALTAYRKAATKVDLDVLIATTRAYAAAVVGYVPKDKIPHPATWLNAERWTDDPAEWRPQAAPINGRAQRTPSPESERC